ncbi:MAG: response regulator [Candidatus Omnitrophica bacterium]|nr:response regulator [Candidatus Omnitrophota bacterium]
MNEENSTHKTEKPVILVVDNDDAGRDTTVKMIRKAGFPVMEAASGIETLEKACAGPGLMVLEVDLPDMSGFEICRKIKENPATAHIPVLHLSATSLDDQSKVKGLNCGADAYLTQPVELSVLIATINALLRMKQAEEKMTRLARQWQSTFDAVKDAIFILDADQRVVRTNQAADKLFQRPVDAMTGRHCWEIVHGTTEPIPECPLLRVRQSLQRETRELRMGEFWFEVTVDPILDAENRLTGVVHIMSDITERKQAEERIRQSEESYRNIFQNAQVGLFRTRISDGKILESNDQLARMFGYNNREEFIAEYATWKNYVDPGTRERMLEQIHQNGFIENFEARFYRKDRSIFWARYSARLYPEQGWIEGVAQDITEHKRVEEERAKLQEQLQQAQKLESIGRLAGGVAHDFNNMLSVVLGYGEIILGDLHQEDPLRDKVQEMVNAGQRAKALTSQLLAFSRKQTLQPQVLDLNNQIRNIEKMLRRLLAEDIELSLILAKDLPWVLFDPGQLDQVIINLAVNARDAMPKGGRLLIETSVVDLDEAYAAAHHEINPGKYVMLAFTDTGYGMDKETSSRVFEPFFTTKEKGKGTGLGLSTVYGIVKQSGGHIWVYSEPDKGTTFKIYFPPTEEKPKAQEEIVIPQALSSGGHILVVEDDMSVRNLVKILLSSLGYTVTIAANGDEALRLVEKKGVKPDLVITDVVMPKMSGKELIDRLRKTYPLLKALFISGYTDNAIAHHGVLDPGTPFIQKPFTIHDLSRKVREMLGSNRP